jgi:hypothetical protein
MLRLCEMEGEMEQVRESAELCLAMAVNQSQGLVTRERILL